MARMFLSIIIGMITFSSSVYPAGEHRTLSLEEAKKLVLEALPRKARSLPKLSLEGGLDSAYPGFYIFSAMWAGPPDGSVVIGSYAVDSSTGDVFDPASECTEISTPALRKLQEKLRSRIGLSDSAYQKIKGRGPMCNLGEGRGAERTPAP